MYEIGCNIVLVAGLLFGLYDIYCRTVLAGHVSVSLFVGLLAGVIQNKGAM